MEKQKPNSNLSIENKIDKELAHLDYVDLSDLITSLKVFNNKRREWLTNYLKAYSLDKYSEQLTFDDLITALENILKRKKSTTSEQIESLLSNDDANTNTDHSELSAESENEVFPNRDKRERDFRTLDERIRNGS